MDIDHVSHHRAYKKAVGKSSDTRLPGLEYSPNQLFWISGAYGNCFKYKNENDWKQHVCLLKKTRINFQSFPFLGKK